MGTRIVGEALRVALFAGLIAVLGFAALVALVAAFRFARPDGRRLAPLCSETCSFKAHPPTSPSRGRTTLAAPAAWREPVDPLPTFNVRRGDHGAGIPTTLDGPWRRPVFSLAAGQATGTATIHILLRYDAPKLTWRGRFRALQASGTVVGRGRVVDRPRQKLGAEWLIIRKLITRAGTLEFRVSGPLQTPTAQLHWVIVGGTDAYAALKGRGIDVEHIRETTASALMRGVPFA
jgi:hypothetical protein